MSLDYTCTANSTMTLTVGNISTPLSKVYNISAISHSPMPLKETKLLNKLIVEALDKVPYKKPAVKVATLDPKQALITDLGIPRTKRGSMLTNNLFLNEHNDYNMIVAKHCCSARNSTYKSFPKNNNGGHSVHQGSRLFSPAATLSGAPLHNLDNYDEGILIKKLNGLSSEQTING